MFRRLAVLAALAWVVTAVPIASAGSLDACAQRVIRDWYSGGRVDEVYPLPCYRAAIRALPNDVLEYSEADKDIARALAFARRGRGDQRTSDQGTTAGGARQDPAPRTPPAAAPPANDAGESSAPEPRQTKKPLAPTTGDGPSRLASGPEPTEVSAAVPYPVIVLAALAGTLLLTGAVGWTLARRR